MQTIGSPTARSPEPDDARLRRLVRHLVAEKDWVALIRLVERWADGGSPPTDALVAEARAFLSLRLMDRAWVRLKEATDADPDHLDALVLTAQMFIARGWPARARKVLERIRQADEVPAGVDALAELAAQPPSQPPSNARELERVGTPQQVLALAEQYLASGSAIRAQGLLERLRRQDPELPRVNQLLWGIRGEFIDRNQPMVQLLAELEPPIGVTDWDQPDHTESVNISDVSPHADTKLLPTEPKPKGRAFPSLFRSAEQTGDAASGAEREDTIASVMASTEELLDPPTQEHTESNADFGEEGGDTQIMQVIPSGGGGLKPFSGPIHAAHEDKTDSLKRTLDLKAWQHKMGMGGDTLDDNVDDEVDDDDFLEEEDQDLVVMTLREEGIREPAPPPAARRSPIEVVEKHPTPPPRPAVSAPPEPEPPLVPDPDTDEYTTTTPWRIARQWKLLFVALLLMAMGMIAFGFVVVYYLGTIASQNLSSQVHDVLGQGDYDTIVEAQRRVTAQVQDGNPPVGARAAQLAVLDAVMWAEFNGDEALPQAYSEALGVARTEGGPFEDIALAEGIMAWTRGDLDGASTMLGKANQSLDETRYWQARIALDRDDPTAAVKAWGGTDRMPDGLRHQLLLPELVAALDRQDEARTLGRRIVAKSKGIRLAELAQLEQGWKQEGGDVIADITKLIDQNEGLVGSRILGRQLAVKARALESEAMHEQADAAWRAALEKDPTSADLLYRVGMIDYLDGNLSDAPKLLTQCLSHRPFDWDCRRARVQVMLDMDRVDEAKELVTAWTEQGGDVGLLIAWTALADNDYDAVIKATDSFAHSASRGASGRDGLAWYLRGLALGFHPRKADPEESVRLLVWAQNALGTTGDPLDNMLHFRAEAARGAVAPALTEEKVAKRGLHKSQHDPMVRIYAGLYFEAVGNGPRAEDAMKAAYGDGNAPALVRYYYGHYYHKSGTGHIRDDAWESYLQANPSGPRAEEIRRKMRRR